MMVLGLMLAGFTAQAAGDLEVLPATSVESTGFTQGPFSVTRETYSLANTSASTVVQWQAQKDQPWVSVSQTDGDLDPGDTIEIEILINALALDLPVGTHVATITFWDFTNFASETRNVTLDITLPGPGDTEIQSVVVSNQYAITLTGEPGSTYVVEGAPAVEGPWNGVVTNDFASLTALFEFTADQPGQYYRVVSSGVDAVPASLSVAQVEALDNSIVRVTGEVNGVYLVEGSTNTVDFIPVFTNKVPASGEFTFTNTLFAPDLAAEYRAVPAVDLDLPTLHHVLIAGESLAVGIDGDPALSTTPSEFNFRYRTTDQGRFFSPLVETGIETIASGAAGHVIFQAPLHRMMTSNIGKNGATYDQQKQGTELFALGLQQFADAPQVVACRLFGYQPRGIFVVGGEGDQLNPDFGTDMREWQANYQREIQFLTGFTGLIPMFHTQIAAWTSLAGGGFESVTGPSDLLVEYETNPNRTILVGPRYFLPYATAEDGASFPGLHPTNEGYRWLGEYYGKVYKQVVVDGLPWSPVPPTSITRSGTVITAVFEVPAPPLVLDSSLVLDPGNFGFEFTSDDVVPPSITGVSLVGDDTVEIQLSAEPVAGNERLRYAYTGIPGNSGGPTTGPRGNLRDSDPTPSVHGNNLFNWCVVFDKPVN